jgi:cytochrome oxidase Cu insertion factor (SCO1/SenC/PrrC family)
MENRLARARFRRPGAALIALAAIVLITAAWWALALWPAGAVEPMWLARTRAACFGSVPGGLPDAGGWILLIGEPIGMLGVLVVVWGEAVRDEFRVLMASRLGRLAAASLSVLAVAGIVSIGARVARAGAPRASESVAPGGRPVRVERDAPVFSLVDQHGKRTALADFRGHTVLVTFAFGHCTTVCPAIVSGLQVARRAAKQPGIPLVVITMDPWRDTPERLAMLAEHWDLAPGDRVLSGDIADVERALDALGVSRTRDQSTGDIVHTATAMILDRRGQIAWRVDGGWGGVEEILERLP